MDKTAPNVTETNVYYRDINNRSDASRYLQDLISALSVSKENYETLAGITESTELNAIWVKNAAQRADFIAALLNHLGASIGISGSTTPKEHTDAIQSAIVNENTAMINTTIASELKSISKYQIYLHHNIPRIEHLHLLTDQMKTIKHTTEELKSLLDQYSLYQ
jgi:hypothetical protein